MVSKAFVAQKQRHRGDLQHSMNIYYRSLGQQGRCVCGGATVVVQLGRFGAQHLHLRALPSGTLDKADVESESITT